MDASAPAVVWTYHLDFSRGSYWPPVRLVRFMVDNHTGRRSCPAEPIHTHPLTNLLIGPLVIIRPAHQLVVDPGEQADRAIGQRRADCVGTRLLDQEIAAAIRLIVLTCFKTCYLLWRV